MTIEIAALFLLLLVMVYLFLTEKIPVDLTAFLGLVALIFGGYVAPDEAFTGFASSAVITMLAIFIISGSLLHTGIADVVARRVHQWVGGREVPLIVTIMLAAGILSAFMNNIAATAVLMPAVAGICRRAGIAPSRLFMPLSFGAILGGTTTMVGTPPNILAADMLKERGLEPFGLFDFTPVGLVLLGLGILFMVTFGRRLLPASDPEAITSAAEELADVYQLHHRFFSLRIPKGSALDGATLGGSRMGTALGVKVIQVYRDGKEYLAPSPSTTLREGDVLLVEGKIENLRHLLDVQKVDVEKAAPGDLPRPKSGVSGIKASIPSESPLVGQTLRQVGFRDQYGVIVVGIERDGKVLHEELRSVVLQEGDRLLALGTRSQLEKLRDNSTLETVEVGLSAVQQLQEELYLIRVREDSPLVGNTVESSRIGELVGVTVGGIIREGRIRLAVGSDEPIQAGDLLLVSGDPTRIVRLMEVSDILLDQEEIERPTLESEDVGVIEAAIAPRSSLVGQSIRDLSFRDRYSVQVLSIWREGEPIHGDLADIPFQFGDALLLQGDRERLARLAADPDFVVLSDIVETPRRTEKAPVALGGLLLMVLLVITGYQPIHVAAFTAASIVVLLGALSMQEAYRAVEWRAIFLVAAVLPVGMAMERTGAALLMASTVTDVVGPFGSYAVTGAMVVLSSLLSQGLDGAPAVVLLTPVALQAAETLGLSPYPIMMAVSLAASAAFMTPFSHKANLLVMGAGGYRSMDYIRVGTPLTIVLLVVMTLLVPVFFSF